MRLVVSLVAIVALALGFSPPVSAQEELTEGVALELLSFAFSDAVPEGADQVVLVRMTIAPGASCPIAPEDGTIALAEVESGTLTSEVDGDSTVIRDGAEPGEEETAPGGEPLTLEAGDGVLYPPSRSGEIRNESDDDATLLVFQALSSQAVADDAPEIPEGIVTEVLTFGQAPALTDAGAILILARVTYEPGARQDQEEQPGSEISLVESGEFVMEAISGPDVMLWRGLGEAIAAHEEPVVEMISAGSESAVAAGDAAFTPAGNASAARNDGEEDAVALLAFIMPAEALMEME